MSKKRPPPEIRLNPRAHRFALLVASGVKPSAAYRDAYDISPDTPERQVYQSAYITARRPAVEDKIRELRQQSEKGVRDKVVITTLDLLHEIKDIARSDIRQFFDDDGRVKNPATLSDGLAAAVSAADITEHRDRDGNLTTTYKIKLWDKMKAIDMAMKHLGAYEADNKQQSDPLKDLARSLAGNVLDAEEARKQYRVEAEDVELNDYLEDQPDESNDD